jgi:hypothetical protein
VDGERLRKWVNGAPDNGVTWYVGADAELRSASYMPSGQWTSFLSGDVRKSGSGYDYLLRDHLGSVRVSVPQVLDAALTGLTRHDYGPFGAPLVSNGAVDSGSKAYINERVACPREGGGCRDGPAISQRPLFRPQPRALLHTRHLGPDSGGGGDEQVCLCGE